MNEDWTKYIPYTFSEVVTILSSCSNSDELFEISWYLDEYKKKYTVKELKVINNFLHLKYIRISKAI